MAGLNGLFDSDSDGSADFEGFNHFDVILAGRNAQRRVDNSDIEFSDDDFNAIFDSDSDEGSDFEGFDDEDIEPAQHARADAAPNIRWEENANFPPARAEFSGPDPGPTNSLGADATPLDFFHLFLPSDFFVYWAEQTNLFARQVEQDSGNKDKYWTPTSADELKAFLGLHVIMAIDHKPNIGAYWSDNKHLGNPGIKACMTKNRFEKLLQYMHIADNSKQPARDSPQYDALFKVRPIMEQVKLNSRENFNPNPELSIDEMMIGFKGRLFFRQYMPAKPTKWGIKTWAIADPGTGYTLDFNVYTGKGQTGTDQTHGLGYNVIMELTRPYFNKNHEIIMDNFFSSVDLIVDLLDKDTYATVTTRPNRKNFPPVLKLPKGKKNVQRARRKLLRPR
jgi:hypothetical protein